VTEITLARSDDPDQGAIPESRGNWHLFRRRRNWPHDTCRRAHGPEAPI